MRISGNTAISLVAAWIALFCTLLAAWITHVVWIIGALASDAGATTGQMVLGVIGIFPPVGIIHGLMIWLGAGI